MIRNNFQEVLSVMSDKSQLYSEERKKRWEEGDKGEPLAITKIEEVLSDYIITTNKVKSIRYDKMWFDIFNPEDDKNEWVRGASDYCLDFEDTLVYAEIKIKNERFRKTLKGGKTDAGSEIVKYGCESFYLDIDPVLKNMNAFCERLHINKDSFLVFFCNTKCNDIRFISLSQINDLAQNGYNGKPLNKFTEGYGTKTKNGRAVTYLIPVDTTIDLFDMRNTLIENKGIEKNYLLEYARKICRVFYTENQSFYHFKRDCRYLGGKEDKDVKTCGLIEIMNKRKTCTCCGKKPDEK